MNEAGARGPPVELAEPEQAGPTVSARPIPAALTSRGLAGTRPANPLRTCQVQTNYFFFFAAFFLVPFFFAAFFLAAIVKSPPHRFQSLVGHSTSPVCFGLAARMHGLGGHGTGLPSALCGLNTV